MEHLPKSYRGGTLLRTVQSPNLEAAKTAAEELLQAIEDAIANELLITNEPELGWPWGSDEYRQALGLIKKHVPALSKRADTLLFKLEEDTALQLQ